ncbi:MAG: MMPL family transporter [Chloroflexia bacterium]|nr:MMPL family transporter [Chloroflexia bacterium]
MFYRLGYIGFRYRYLVLAIWLALFLVSAPTIRQLPSVLKVGGFSNPNIESARARAVLEDNLPSFSPSVLVVIFESEEYTAFDPEFSDEANRVIDNILTISETAGATRFQDSPRQISSDGHTAYSAVQINLSPEESQRLMPEIRDVLPETSIATTLAGVPAFYEDVETISEQDLQRAELFAIPFALIALLLVFGTVVGAAVPLFVGGVSVATVLGLVFLLAQRVDMSIFVLNLTTMLGLGLAIDYSLFMTSRFREELDKRSVEEAVAVTVGTAGRAVFFSGLTVLIGLGGLAQFDFMFLRSVGIAGVAVVSVGMIGALTLLPAVLGIVGQRINRFQIIKRKDDSSGTFWVRLSNVVMDHPWKVFIPTLAFLLLLGIPFLDVELSSPDATILPTRVESRQGFEVLRREFGDGEISPIVVALETDTNVTDRENLAALYDFTRDFAADDRVTRIDSIVTLDPRLTLDQYNLLYNSPGGITDQFVQENLNQLASENATVVLLYIRGLAGDDESKALLTDVRNYQFGGDFRVLVDGGTAEIVDVVNLMYDQFPYVALVIVLATYFVLLFLFRSVVLPLKAILINTLSIAASYGALVFIFQQGNFSSILGFEPQGYVEASLPIIMFCVLFGLSMDYEVFLLSRVRETYLETNDNRQSVAIGLQRSGRIITGAALIVVVVTASFVTAEIVLVKALGLGIAIAVFLDATIARALLVPSTMRLLGNVNWWLPKWLQRLLPKKEYKH